MVTFVMTVAATLLAYAAVIALTRLAGLRSFAKMSAFDAAGTFAIGSLVATIATRNVPLPIGLTALATLFAATIGMAVLRRRTAAKRAIDNTPVMLMDGPHMLEENMKAADIHVDDLHAQLRRANVTRLEQVRYVVLETTGDISVLHTEPGGPPVADAIMAGVRR